ncbi:MAG: type II secretion system GspH family protein [Ruminococcus sp.]|nr:type II secretion system GspH family protein [Ruminococcus sp.]MDE6848749.1 type II secretion system GspH family protein [Ruminococcus sp.]MDE7138075.1 type II secretion system GspH family protein [Ruminococcus sp.]
MKTTKKKGFTLIELIVVIAIIGVLAAILVPSMLGYVKKSKIQGANSEAATLGKAANSAATELDEEDKIIADGYHSFSKTDADEVNDEDDIKEAIKPFFGDIDSIDSCVGFKDGACVVAAVRSGKYYGTWPTYYTAKNWDDDDHPAPDTAEDAATAVAEEKGLMD